MAIYLINSNKQGLASTQLAKQIRITQKSAWFMLQRIRLACQDDTFNLPFGGITETKGSKIKLEKSKTHFQIDEAYFGGKEGNKRSHKKGLVDKTPVLGFINRDTKKAKAMSQRPPLGKLSSAKGYDL